MDDSAEAALAGAALTLMGGGVATRRGLGRAAGVALGVVVALGAALALATVVLVSWPISDPGLRQSVVARLTSSSGLDVTAAGTMRLRLTPRPTIDIRDVAMNGLGGEVAIEAAGLVGQLSLSALLHGRLAITTATVDRPTIVVDLDRLEPLADAIFVHAATQGTAGAPPDPASEPLRFLRTDGLSLRSGVVRLLSKDPGRDTVLTEVSATVDWPSGLGAAGLTGSATWRGIPASFAVSLDTPGPFLAGGTSEGSLRLRSPVLDLSVTGSVATDHGLHGLGKLTATTADLGGFLRGANTPLPQLAGLRRASLSGQATFAPGSLSLSDAELGLDDMIFEGAMVVHGDAEGHAGLAGTLATEQIDLNPFLAVLPALRQPAGTWSRTPLDARSVADDDIDLRISASKARIGPLVFEDGSLSLQSGSGRMELSLGEARAYDGLLKGRLVAMIDRDETDIRADLSLSRVDLAGLAADLGQPDLIAGTATGHVMLEGQGRSPDDLIRSLGGRGQVSLRNGALATTLASGVMRIPADGPPATTAFLNRVTAFDSATTAFEVHKGLVVLSGGAIVWPDATAALTGSAALPAQSLDVTADMTTLGDEAPPPGPGGFALVGPWRDLKLVSTDGVRLPDPGEDH